MVKQGEQNYSHRQWICLVAGPWWTLPPCTVMLLPWNPPTLHNHVVTLKPSHPAQSCCYPETLPPCTVMLLPWNPPTLHNHVVTLKPSHPAQSCCYPETLLPCTIMLLPWNPPTLHNHIFTLKPSYPAQSCCYPDGNTRELVCDLECATVCKNT